MKWNVKDAGDPLERKCHDLITKQLKKYQEFWSNYVGNYNGKPLRILNITPELDKKRLLIAQWNYTILRNTYSIELLLNSNKKKKNKDIYSVIKQENDFLLATHLVYNSIEIMNKINYQLDLKNCDQISKGFIDFRNHLTHNIKPFTKISNKNLHVPSNFDWFSNINIDTNESWIWSVTDFSGLKFHSLINYLDWCFQKLIDLFNQLLTNEIQYFKDKLGGIKIPELDIKIISNIDLDEPSGTSFISV